MNTASQNNPTKAVLIAAVVVILAIIAYAILTMPDNRNGAERIGDAISELPNGVDKAADQLGDRTPGEKLGDAVEDTGESIKRATDND